MTTILGHFKTRAGKESSSGMERIKVGYLQVHSSGHKDPQQKWVTLEKQILSDGSFLYQLNIHTNNKEKKLKRKTHSLDLESFIGIEEGNVGTESNRYFTLFFTKNVVIFQTKDREEANDWCQKFKEHFKCERWTVRLMDSDELSSKLIPYLLHVTSSAVSLTTFNPSELYKRWSIKHINCVACDNGLLSIGVTGAGVDSGFYQIKPHNSTQMTQMKEAIDNKRKNGKKDKIPDQDAIDDPEQNPGIHEINEPTDNAPSTPTSTTAPVIGQGSVFPDVVVKDKPKIARPLTLPTAPVISLNHFPDVIPGTEKQDDGLSAIELQKDYQNVDTSLPVTPTIKKPPPLPYKDRDRHFKSETVGETISAIRAKKHCFRDSLNIKLSKRDNLFAKMDATGWWKDLAAGIGLNVSDIEMIENLAPVLSKSWTETVIYHWECTRNPLRICSIREIQNIALETNRHDLLSMLAGE